MSQARRPSSQFANDGLTPLFGIGFAAVSAIAWAVRQATSSTTPFLDGLAATFLLLLMGGLRAAFSEVEAANHIAETIRVRSSKYTSMLAGSTLVLLLYIAAAAQAVDNEKLGQATRALGAFPMVAYVWTVSGRLPLLSKLGRAANLMGIVGGFLLLLRFLALPGPRLAQELALGPDGWLGWCLDAGFGLWICIVSVVLIQYARRRANPQVVSCVHCGLSHDARIDVCPTMGLR